MVPRWKTLMVLVMLLLSCSSCEYFGPVPRLCPYRSATNGVGTLPVQVIGRIRNDIGRIFGNGALLVVTLTTLLVLQQRIAPYRIPIDVCVIAPLPLLLQRSTPSCPHGDQN